MKDIEKKKENNDLPANKPRVIAPEKVKAVKEPAPGDLEHMKTRLSVTTDPNQRKALLEIIRERFGNEATEKIVTELRLRKDEKKEG